MKSDRIRSSKAAGIRGESLSELLLQAVDLLQFLDSYQRAYRAAHGKKLNLAELARRSGFDSRSSVRDFFVGRRSLSASALGSLAKAMGMTPYQRRVFAALATPGRGDHDGVIEPEASLARAKRRLRKSLQVLRSDQAASIFRDPRLPVVYAALGSFDRGSTFEEIQVRTRLDRAFLPGLLEELVTLGLAKADGSSDSKRYLPLQTHIDYRRQRQPGFVAYYQAVMLDLSRQAQRSLGEAGSLFQVSTFSVRSASLQEKLDRLNSLIVEWVQSAEDEEGDTVLTLGLGATAAMASAIRS